MFDDQRHFGLMKIVSTGQFHEAKELKKLAPEPLSDEFSPDYLYTVTRGSKRKLKEFLIDQTAFADGNILRLRSNVRCGLNPKRSVGRLTKPSAAKLYESILAVLNEAVDHGASRPVQS